MMVSCWSLATFARQYGRVTYPIERLSRTMAYIWEKDHRFSPPDGYRIVAEAVHPNAFPATGYEVRRPWERRRLRQRQYAMRLYERSDGPWGATLTSR